jgi:AraC-like DNA-binding protein
MDVLSDILGAVRLQGTLYFTTEFTRPWGLRVPALQRVARFHLVLRGNTWIRVIGLEDPVYLESGDLIMIPHGAEHVLADTPDTPCRTMDEIVRLAGFTGRGALVYGGPDTGAPTRLVCGHFAFDDAFDHPVLATLPPALVVRWDDAVRDSPLEDAFRFIAREAQEARPGHEAVVRRMSEVLFVQALRQWAVQAAPDQGLLAALADPRLAEALAAIHAEPATAWTLESLGRRAAMGRTAFAERFREVVGSTPLQYLTSWRIQQAKRLLAESQLSLAQIAGRVGYESGASFSRVFRKATGATPGSFRRTARAGAA